MTSPVRFADMIVAMHDQGARVFVEVGPGGVLTPLIGSILDDRPHLAVASDVAGRPSLVGLLHALARLVVAGLPVRLGPLARGRAKRTPGPREPHRRRRLGPARSVDLDRQWQPCSAPRCP